MILQILGFNDNYASKVLLALVCVFAGFRLSAATFDGSSATLTHAYAPFRPGMVYDYVGYGNAVGVTAKITLSGPETVDGVQCVKLLQTSSYEFDQTKWYAQDTEGNVWLLRSHDAHPLGGYDETDVVYMPARLSVGMKILDAQDDEWTVESLSTKHTTPFGSFPRCLLLKWNFDDIVLENSYAPGVGPVVEHLPNDAAGLHLASVSGLDGVANTGRLVVGVVRLDADGAPPLEGVEIDFTPPVGLPDLVTDEHGEFEAGNIPPRTFRITPSLDGHTFSPVFVDIAANGDVEDLEFEATVAGASWAGYSVTTNPDGSKWADASSDWYGFINIDSPPFFYNFESDLWIFMNEPDPEAAGSWGYIFKKSASHTPVNPGWGGYEIITNPDSSNWVDTSPNWMGYLNMDSGKFHYWLERDLWAFTSSEPDSAANGAWFFIFKR